MYAVSGAKRLATVVNQTVQKYILERIQILDSPKRNGHSTWRIFFSAVAAAAPFLFRTRARVRPSPPAHTLLKSSTAAAAATLATLRLLPPVRDTAKSAIEKKKRDTWEKTRKNRTEILYVCPGDRLRLMYLYRYTQTPTTISYILGN